MLPCRLRTLAFWSGTDGLSQIVAGAGPHADSASPLAGGAVAAVRHQVGPHGLLGGAERRRDRFLDIA